ncbi:MAG: hypothetical protein LBK03_01780 [Bacteroidales bacterium]|jgi:hypothetical protein|nr:hypothetical protein [Bacteroidales bacterium]
MKNSLIKLLTGVIVLFTLQSYSSHKEKREIENGLIVNTFNRQTNIQRIDSIDIIQLAKDRWVHITSPDCMPDCINILTFEQDGTFQDDNSDWGLVYDGQFKISGDTLFLTEYDYASQVPTHDNKIVPKLILTYIYMTDSLKLIDCQPIEDGQIVSIYYPKNPVYYYRDKGSDSIRLEGTKWVYEVGKDCLDYILFKNDNQCEFYSCEIGKKYFGIYFCKRNYITMSLSDSELREDNHRDVTIDRIRIRNNFLHFDNNFRLNTITGKWEKSYVIDNDYIFYREK